MENVYIYIYICTPVYVTIGVVLVSLGARFVFNNVQCLACHISRLFRTPISFYVT